MNPLAHLLWSLIIPLLFSFFYPVGAMEFAFSIAFGLALDLDHLYYVVRYHGLACIMSLETVNRHLKEAAGAAVRYHTAAHELLGMVFVIVSSVGMALEFSSLTAGISLFSYFAHVVMDVVSVRMMPFSPFSRREIYVGWISPGGSRERTIVLCSLVLLILLFILVLTKP